jgi:Holliday junction resolvase RusA-like endonuclease
MEIEFILPVKAFSINQMSCRDARFKTSAYKDWATAVLQYIRDLDNYKTLLDIAAEHKAKNGTFSIKIIVHYPFHEFFNKSQQVSSKTIDVTNFEKPLVDLIFKDIMELNDKYVTEMLSRKEASSHHYITVAIRLSATDVDKSS